MGAFGQALKGLSEQMVTLASTYDPNGMLEWESDMKALEEVIGDVGSVIKVIQSGADGLDVNPAVRETIGSVAALQSACASAASEIHATFEAIHAQELDRLRNPRAGSEKWDQAANR